MQKKAKQLKITSYFIKSFDCHSVKHATSCNHHDTFTQAYRCHPSNINIKVSVAGKHYVLSC